MYIEKDKPFLGICLGLQLLFDSSEENGPGILFSTSNPFSHYPFPNNPIRYLAAITSLYYMPIFMVSDSTINLTCYKPPFADLCDSVLNCFYTLFFCFLGWFAI